MKLLPLFFGCLWALLLSACGGGGSSAPPPPPVTFTTQPVAVSAYETQTATFSVVAVNNGTLTYQWRKNGTDISGAKAADYTTAALVLGDQGAQYSVLVSNGGDAATSNTAAVTVLPAAPAISLQPAAQTAANGSKATFGVTATGLPTLRYQWSKNGNPIAGATTAAYTTPNTTNADNGASFSVLVTNLVGATLASTPVALSVQPVLTHLVISEVSSCWYTNVTCWFEIYNPTATTINLSNYRIKAGSVDVTTSPSYITNTIFNLPALAVPPDTYVVVTGNVDNLPQRGSQLAQMRVGNFVPYWNQNGFVELLNLAGTTTVDFVRFGTSLQAPVTASEWSGPAAAALPAGPSEYGKSLVRPYPLTENTDTNTASDWVNVLWTTAGGHNDVPPTAVDADGDGIPNTAKVAGGTFAGMDLYAMGARLGQRDIFIEVDRMDSTEAGINPRAEALQKVVDAFASQNIKIHFDAGIQFSAGFSAANFNLGQGNNVVPYERCVTMDQVTCNANTSSRRSVYDWKYDNFDLRRLSIFHYLLFGSTQLANGAGLGSSGLAETPGNDLIVTFGGWGLTSATATGLNVLINVQASTVMHELGHNLGLKHGGFESANYKPNYWSVMNYLYQLNGLDANPASNTAYLRWRKEKGDQTPTACNLVNSPCGAPAQFVMNYSDGSSKDLNEASLLEADNIGRGAVTGAYADWNLTGIMSATAYAKDLNGDGTTGILKDYNDWANLQLPFRSAFTNSGASLTPNSSRDKLDPLSNDRQPVAIEPPMSSRMLEALRNAR